MTTSLLVDSLLALVPEKLVPKNSIIGPAQLGRLPLFLYAGGNTRAIVDTWFHRAGSNPKPIMELGNVEAIKVLVASSLGGSILPNLALHKVTARTVGCRLRPSLERKLAYVLRKEKVVDRGLRVLIELVPNYVRPPRRQLTAN
jgi:DNA-binding transcriptional LysR family regulator